MLYMSLGMYLATSGLLLSSLTNTFLKMQRGNSKQRHKSSTVAKMFATYLKEGMRDQGKFFEEICVFVISYDINE